GRVRDGARPGGQPKPEHGGRDGKGEPSAKRRVDRFADREGRATAIAESAPSTKHHGRAPDADPGPSSDGPARPSRLGAPGSSRRPSRAGPEPTSMGARDAAAEPDRTKGESGGRIRSDTRLCDPLRRLWASGCGAGASAYASR